MFYGFITNTFISKNLVWNNLIFYFMMYVHIIKRIMEQYLTQCKNIMHIFYHYCEDINTYYLYTYHFSVLFTFFFSLLLSHHGCGQPRRTHTERTALSRCAVCSSIEVYLFSVGEWYDSIWWMVVWWCVFFLLCFIVMLE